MDERQIAALKSDLMEFAGATPEDIEFLEGQVENIRRTQGDEAADAILKGASTKVRQAAGEFDGDIADTLSKGRTTEVVGDQMVTKGGEGFTEKLGGTMRGKGATEHINNKIVSTPDTRSAALRRISGEAGDEMMSGMDNVLGGASKFLGKGAKKAAKIAKKIPGVGMMAGPVLGGLGALAMGASPSEAMASGAAEFAPTGVEEAFGELADDTDQVPDMGLSRADLGQAERRTIDAMEEREDEEDEPKKRSFGVLGE